ncbi:carboxymuconolactone decarboxylase family protein [Variovorax paradoxus]|nr:carboxymuconolactone decarboxylase family protein [Variovorax paradoxus]
MKHPDVERLTAEGFRVYEAAPQLGRIRNDVVMGDVWKQPELALRDRSLVTVSILAAQGNFDEMKVHMSRAVDNGVTLDELRGLIVQVAVYAGWPAGVMAGKAALPLLEAGEAKP